MNTADLSGPLLASVSRTFYLSLRLLPGTLRTPIGLAYLLARASDTIADTADAPAEIRLWHLVSFSEMVQTGSTAALPELQHEIHPADPAERTLIAQLGRCLDWLSSLDEFDRAEIVAVLEKVIRGQTLDLERFSDPRTITALQSASELEEYTYLVAGCVGEFWTRACFHHVRNYATLDAAELAAIGCDFGKGLQLVNILRDLPNDLRAGRCYLPEDELRAAGTSPGALLTAPAAAAAVVDRWLARAGQHLAQGERYIAALRPARIRAGCFLPWYLGRKTVALLRQQPALEAKAKVKVSRATVQGALALAVPIAFSNRALERTSRSA